MNPVEKIARCREYARRFVDIQRDEFRRLGVFGDWDNPYLTMAPAYEAVIARDGLIRGGWKTIRRVARCGPWTAVGTRDDP